MIGVAGNTGLFSSSRPLSDPDRGTHLHMEVSQNEPSLLSGNVYQCSNSVGTLPPSPHSIADFGTKNTFGFEETANNWPPADPLASSYNWTGIQQNDCNPCLGRPRSHYTTMLTTAANVQMSSALTWDSMFLRECTFHQFI